MIDCSLVDEMRHIRHIARVVNLIISFFLCDTWFTTMRFGTHLRVWNSWKPECRVSVPVQWVYSQFLLACNLLVVRSPCKSTCFFISKKINLLAQDQTISSLFVLALSCCQLVRVSMWRSIKHHKKQEKPYTLSSQTKRKIMWVKLKLRGSIWSNPTLEPISPNRLKPKDDLQAP